jgi:hypothetical protein
VRRGRPGATGLGARSRTTGRSAACSRASPTESTHSVATAKASQRRAARAGSLMRVYCHCHPPLGTPAALVNPGPDRVGAGVAGLGCEVRQDEPGVDVVRFPAGEQGAGQPACRRAEGHAGPTPYESRLGHQRFAPRPAGLATGAELGGRVDAQEGLPAQAHAAPAEPAGIPAAVGQHQHRLLGGDDRLEQAHQDQPLAAPRVLLLCRQDFPGHGDGAAALDHAESAHHAAVA